MTKWIKFPQGTCHIYLIAHKAGDGLAAPVNVGITTSLGARIATLQTGNPASIELVASFATPATDMARYFERAFHEIHASKRLTGEWFDIEPKDALISLMMYVASGLQLNMPGVEREFLEDVLDRAGFNEAVEILNRRWPGEAMAV